jgi:acetylornithine/succinyldiaminopimelate/putrescine aminotransferase
MVAIDEVAAAFTPGSHASTFGGNPIAMAAGAAAMKAIIDEGIIDNCRRVGAYLVERLNELKGEFPSIREIRGMGLIVGMEIDAPGAPIVSECMERGLLINCTGESVLRFLPPLTVTEGDVDEMLGILKVVLKERLGA